MGAREEEGAAGAEAAVVAVGVSSPARTRIYVGGLSGGVTAADVEKTFSSLGSVSRVELVRTDGRNFAFMDFKPKSDKSLARLFATYNGCTWKGGRLKLEKAKEHYLDRLRREWAEDAEDAEDMSGTPVNLDTDKKFRFSDKSKCMAQEKMQLRIFFPKLRKVKALPFRGTGKHKYSFQRIAVPSLPVHFCDCEEHYGPSEEASQNCLSSLKNQISVVNEEELNIMNSVMNKLLEKESNTIAADGGASSPTEGDILDHSINKTQVDEREATQETDADNLVTNIGLGGSNDDVLDLIQPNGWETTSVDHQVSRFGRHQNFNGGSSREEKNSQKRQRTGPNSSTSEVTFDKKASCLLADKSENGELSPVVPGKKRSQETQSEKMNGFRVDPPVQTQTNQDSAVGHPVRGASWLQKSSWKELVGNTVGSTFSISHVLPGIDSAKPKLSRSSGEDSGLVLANTNAAAMKGKPEESDGGCLEPLKVRQTIPVVKKAVTPDHEDEGLGEGDGIPADAEEHDDRDKSSVKRSDREAKIAVAAVGEVCTFMRSAHSEEEWTKARAALSGYFRRTELPKVRN